MSKFMIVGCEAGDWEGLYIDGKLVEEGHKIHRDTIFEHLGINADYSCASDNAMDKMGCSFPEKLDEVILDI